MDSLSRRVFLGAAAALAAPALPPEAGLRFHPAPGGGFRFDTGMLAGKAGAGGLGLTDVVHVPSGMPVSQRHGLFSIYRVFSGGTRHGRAAWEWTCEARATAAGELELHWPASGGRPFVLRAVYRWAAPDTLDLETQVEAQAGLPEFETFVSCYFSPLFNQTAAYSRPPGEAPRFVPAEERDGNWQWFPRDAAAAALVGRGRYKIPPNPVDWAMRPPLAAPVALRRAPEAGLAAAVMARPEECIGLAMPYGTEAHYSIYTALFGRTVAAGQSARARARLKVGALTDAQVLETFRGWLSGGAP